MSNRHLARILVLQTLYEWDFYHGERDAGKILERNLRDWAPQLEEKGFTRELTNGFFEHRDEIDSAISKFAPDWPLQKITPVDRNVLRIGTFELLYNFEIPSKVAINEAIELSKTFGGESSGKFVNGVLGAVYRDQLARGISKDSDQTKDKKEEKAEPTENET